MGQSDIRVSENVNRMLLSKDTEKQQYMLCYGEESMKIYIQYDVEDGNNKLCKNGNPTALSIKTLIEQIKRLIYLIIN